MAESSFTNSNLRLAGKIAIVTGGASSIGKETAHVFVEQGACMVVIADIQDELCDILFKPNNFIFLFRILCLAMLGLQVHLTRLFWNSTFLKLTIYSQLISEEWHCA
ncbi:putative oxidoreductase [Medicago truncatula]|uniref:Putative oxidoreductase n=1 Tax=Medicago truncatula TaxID=3880 RepID=A0A396HBB1_MEDTR|nr:putative oxidoreductase [Medicago truncatula]